VSADDPESNFGVARRVLLDPLKRSGASRGPRVFPMPGGHRSLPEAAVAYEHLLDHELKGDAPDLAILGVGEDGHVGAVFPGEALLGDRALVMAVENAPRPPSRRLTMTLPFLLRSRTIWIVAVGPRKRAVLQAAVSRRGQSTPIDLVFQHGRHMTVFTDQAVHL
jgi:6-phosphogluconolactonase